MADEDDVVGMGATDHRLNIRGVIFFTRSAFAPGGSAVVECDVSKARDLFYVNEEGRRVFAAIGKVQHGRRQGIVQDPALKLFVVIGVAKNGSIAEQRFGRVVDFCAGERQAAFRQCHVKEKANVDQGENADQAQNLKKGVLDSVHRATR